MKKSLFAALAISSLLSIPANLNAEQLLAFPGAEGFGRFATGGRGGEIYHVTNLNDSGTGSFRDAISKSNRIIVFDVSGVIRLKSGLVFKNNLTILGQTAPGEGIQLYGARTSFSGANNIVVRYLRIRMGVNGESGKDAAGIAYGHDMIFDHTSVLWGRDENFSVNWDTKKTDQEPTNITIQNSIMGQGLQPHSCGGLIQTNGGVTLFRNLYIENSTRNPKVKGLNQFVNNVICNWGEGAAYNMGGESEGNSWAEITGNYFMRGPWKSAARPLSGGNSNFRFYGDDNYYDSNLNGVLDGTALSADDYKASGGNVMASIEALENAGSPQKYPEITNRMTAVEAIDWVAKNVGASLPVRDEVDQYLIDELLSYGSEGTTGGISSEMQLPHKGTGKLFGGYKPLDTDGDGIPDEWEINNGLNPNDPSDAAKIASNGYANIENYSFTIDAAYPYLKNPTDLKATANEKNAVELSWTDNSDTEKEFVVELSEDGKDYKEATRTMADVTKCRVENLETNKIYYFRVKAIDNDGLESVYCQPLQTLTIETPTAPEQTVLVSPANGAEVKQLDLVLTWKNATKEYFGKTTYDVLVGTDENSLEKIAEDLTDTTLTPGLLEAGKTYYWRVDASNDVGTTESKIGNFKVVEGGTLFYTDFDTKPQSFQDSEWGAEISGSQADILKAGTTEEVEFDNLTVGTKGGRIVSFGNLKASSYGPYSSKDNGASDRAIGFIGKNGKVSTSYITVNEIEGPWEITLYTGNSDAAKLTFDLTVEGESSPLATFNLAASKKVFKFTYIYDKEGVSNIVINNVKSDTDKKGLNFFDIKVDKYVKPSQSGIATVEDDGLKHLPLEVYGGTLTVNNVEAGLRIDIYDLSGRLVDSALSSGGSVSFAPGKGVYIVKAVNYKPAKVII